MNSNDTLVEKYTGFVRISFCRTYSPDRIWSSSLPAAYIRYSDTPSLLDTNTSPPRIAVSAVRPQWLHPRPDSTCSHHLETIVINHLEDDREIRKRFRSANRGIVW